jgi:hypothetical protein
MVWAIFSDDKNTTAILELLAFPEIEPVEDKRSQFIVNLKFALIALMQDRCSHERRSSR